MTVSETARRVVRSTLSLVPIDLVLVLAYVTFATAAVETGEGSTVQFLIGVGLVLFAPGYTVVAALFPARARQREERQPTSVLALTRPHDGVLVRERLALAFGVSVLLLPIVAVAYGAVGISLTTSSILAAVWAIVGVGAVVGTARRLALPEREQFDLLRVAQGVGTGRPLADDSTTTLLTVALCCMVVVSLGAFSAAIAGPSQSMSYTSASLLTTGQNGEPVASGYPANVSQDESVPLVVRVTNHHDTAANYTVVTRLQRVEGGTVQSGQRVWQGRQRLGVNETWTQNHTVVPPFAGQDLRLTYFVYRGSVPETVSQSTADDVLYLRLDVFPNGARNPQTPTGNSTGQG
ncbi:DUF1616 domain-containing protein [Haloarcula salinisoli]|uniref:DUF1616 domain-containing protein n=1 Tax=Haloarcula salinisoli TaxID=2487746 RepID=A0A8J7YJP4_9EURY|nr:DUF1616 domain-containing protein [Halomicroarcula salinisoli]MBX0285455.1 DUF1616 domain-containing protein [Halomicroarcula salinisoli]MBX0303066.1 DUF1616 domain-containing protein [Halomicroarcula salinisoli]